MSPLAIRQAIDQALRPGCFFVAPPRRLRVEHVESEHVPWELFRGHLLDASHARQKATFDAWHVFVDDDGASAARSPLLSVNWDRQCDRIHVTRYILSHTFEAYEDSPGVIQSRPTQKWVTELVGTVDAARFDGDTLAAELGVYVFLAVIGTSRLPITSLESPLPAFSLGHLAYIPQLSDSDQAHEDPIAFFTAALARAQNPLQQAKALETALRATPSDRLAALVDVLQAGAHRRSSTPDDVAALFRVLFNSVALSPYTEFADRMIAVLCQLATPGGLGAPAVVDVVCYMLRHLARHLTAFDLTLFHNFGANYPDALFLDALLKALFRLIDENSELFLQAGGEPQTAARCKQRRRALRQACLVRKHYEGHRVPDAPTSMGENMRVLPEPLARVPEEQITERARRRRALFEGEPLGDLLGEASRRAFEQSLIELRDPVELRELGMAHFLDRPLGICKATGEVDRTPLVSYEAFSRVTAKKRLAELKSAGWITDAERDRLVAALDDLPQVGVPANTVSAVDRPGVVSLVDARKAASDFRFLRTTRGSLDPLLSAYDWRPLAKAQPDVSDWLTHSRRLLLLPNAPQSAGPAARSLQFRDDRDQLRLELGFATAPDGTVRYVERAGVEWVDRLQVVAVRQSADSGEWIVRDAREWSLWIELC